LASGIAHTYAWFLENLNTFKQVKMWAVYSQKMS
jgi:hypothetical protein